MQKKRPSTYNPAAIMGYSPDYIIVGVPRQVEMHAYRKGVRRGKYEGHISCSDHNLLAQLLTLPMFVNQNPSMSSSAVLYFNNRDFMEILDALVLMHRAGIEADDPLIFQQVVSKISGTVTLADQAAYGLFVQTADGFLKIIENLNLHCLENTKGIRSVTSPRIARSMIAGTSGIHVIPDPYDARYVLVNCYSMDKMEFLTVRNAAFDYYEPLGFRVELRLP